MAILLLSGSVRAESSNQRLLEALTAAFPEREFHLFGGLAELPLFVAEADHAPWPEAVLAWRDALRAADAVVISTPEYLHNLPALLKNALEWVASSGEMMGKPVLAVTFTPHAPRGERAMQSLRWSLVALEARIVAELPLYQQELPRVDDRIELSEEARELMAEGLKLLGG